MGSRVFFGVIFGSFSCLVCFAGILFSRFLTRFCVAFLGLRTPENGCSLCQQQLEATLASPAPSGVLEVSLIPCPDLLLTLALLLKVNQSGLENGVRPSSDSWLRSRWL